MLKIGRGGEEDMFCCWELYVLIQCSSILFEQSAVRCFTLS